MSEQNSPPAVEPSVDFTVYAGADWIEENLDLKCSSIGRKAADILGFMARGIYHLDYRALKRVQWTDARWVQFNLRGYLASFDFDELTRLVVAAHDLAVRVEIDPLSPTHLALSFHERARSGIEFYSWHPSIEAHVAMLRKERQG